MQGCFLHFQEEASNQRRHWRRILMRLGGDCVRFSAPALTSLSTLALTWVLGAQLVVRGVGDRLGHFEDGAKILFMSSEVVHCFASAAVIMLFVVAGAVGGRRRIGVWFGASPLPLGKIVLSSAWNCFIWGSVLTFVAPILGTLTRAYSDDTVHALLSVCGVSHMYCAGTKFSSAAALSPSFLFVLLLASRMASTLDVLVYVSASAAMFTGMPRFWRFADRTFAGTGIYASLIVGYAACAGEALRRSRLGDDEDDDEHARLVSIIFVAANGILAIVFPLWFWRMKRTRKRPIPRGAWEPLRIEKGNVRES